MRHSKTSKRSSSSAGKRDKKRTPRKVVPAPVTLEDIQRKDSPVDKDDTNVRMITIRVDPTDVDSATIKRNLKVLNNPENVLEVLKHRKSLEEALKGNDITQGPNQYAFVRQFLEGESLRVFNEGANPFVSSTKAPVQQVPRQ